MRAAGLLGWLLLALAVAAAGLLVAAEFSTISFRSIGAGACADRVGDPAVCSTLGHESHSYALLILAVLALPMAWGAAIGRSRAASLAVVAVGVGVLVIGLLIDAPKLDGKRDLDCCYSKVKGHAGDGFKIELAGGVLLVLAGGLALARPRPAAPRPRRRREPAGETAGTA
jgi:hypothetical protein